MSRRKRSSRKQKFRLSDEPGPGEGLDPRLEPQQDSHRVGNRKALQLCAQVQRTLSMVLAGECEDDVLRDLFVESVVPAPNAGRLLVTVYPSTLGQDVDLADIMHRLGQAAGYLRSEVAAAIHRRKTPELAFRVVAPADVHKYF